jgi:hypothetical protein
MLLKTSPLVWQCQWALNDISSHQTVGILCPQLSVIRGNDTANELAKKGSIHQSVRPELALEVLRPNIKKRQSIGLLTIIRHCDGVLPALGGGL